jgi:signal transduction histidine kinase
LGLRFRRLRLRTILALLVLATTVPLAAFAAHLIRTSWQQQQALVDRQNIDQARAISVAVEQELQRTTAALTVLSSVIPTEEPDRAKFAAIAGPMLPHQGWQAVWLLSAAGELVAGTSDPQRGAVALPPTDWVKSIVVKRRFSVSSVTQDSAATGYAVSVGLPVFRKGPPRYALVARVPTTVFHDLLGRQKAPEGGVVTLIDDARRIIARTRNYEQFVGRSPTPDFIERATASAEGSWRTRTLEGTPSYAAWSRSPTTNWTVGIAVPEDTVAAPIRRSLLLLITAGLATLAGGLILALLLSRGIVSGLEAAALSARSLAAGIPVKPFHSNIKEAQELATGLKDAAGILDVRLRERDEAHRELDQHRSMLLEREKTARQAAEGLSRAKDEFIATVSHELRTPLNAIFGWVSMMRSGSLDPSRQAHALEVIDRNTRAQARLIEDLLDMSRVIRGEVRLEMSPLDLAQVIDSVVETLKPTAAARHVAVSVRTAAGATVLGDQSRVQQILWNLLSNSLKFTPAGGHVDVTAEIQGDEAVVGVKDDGEGVAPEFLPHMFDRFRQEASDLTRPHAGLGLGLALVRHLTELHGGTVTAESEGKGQGATFTVRLPLIGTPASQAIATPDDAVAPSNANVNLSGLRVLVVDDDPDSRELVTTALAHAGAAVTGAATADEALSVLHSAPTDVIVSDIAMPNGTGYDLARAVRAHPRFGMMPLVAVTAYSRGEDRDRARAAGYNAHVGKPFDPANLVGIVAGLARG